MKYFTSLIMLFVGMIDAYSQQSPLYAPGQLLVRLKDDVSRGLTYQSDGMNIVTTSNQSLNDLFTTLQVKRMEKLHPYDQEQNVTVLSSTYREFVIYFETTSSMEDILNIAKNHSTVELAEPNYLMTAHITPNDPQYGSQWSLPKIKMPAVWDIMRGNTQINIAVLDVGFKLDHQDFGNNKFHQTLRRDETDINWIQPPYVRLLGEDYQTPDNDPSPYFSGSGSASGTHGTHVAGIAGARTNNYVGIAGVAWENIIVPVRCGFMVRDTSQGINVGLLQTADWIRALDWVRVNNAARVVNMSFGGPGDPFA